MPSRTYYLNPRVSDYLVYIGAYAPDDLYRAQQFMAQHPIPYITNVDHIANYIGVSPSLLRQILHRPSFHYSRYSIPKKSGGVRMISAPRTYLKSIQWWILDNILVSATPSEIAQGFVRGRSYATNASLHMNSNHLLNVDIRNFFQNITDLQVYEQFLRLGYDRNGAEVLTELTTLDGCTPTGAPTSPQLGNLVLKEFDEELLAFCKIENLKCTRYADDITISGASRIDQSLIGKVSDLLSEYGFELNPTKTKFMGRGQRMEVTGLLINEKLNINRKWRNRVRGLLHRASLRPDEFRDKKGLLSGINGTLVMIDRAATSKLAKKSLEVMRSMKVNSIKLPKETIPKDSSE